jgi:hypothetical protein
MDTAEERAEGTLQVTETTALATQQAALDAAQAVVDGLATSVQCAAFQAAQRVLDAAEKCSGYVAFEAAKESLEAAKQSQELGAEILKVISGADNLLDIKQLNLWAKLLEIVLSRGEKSGPNWYRNRATEKASLAHFTQIWNHEMDQGKIQEQYK